MPRGSIHMTYYLCYGLPLADRSLDRRVDTLRLEGQGRLDGWKLAFTREGGLPNLAIISSVAPFVGLFGTVWGIMTSFAGIAEAKDTSLAVVAPGIAEALAATAYGLAAAIPASFGYNRIGATLARSGRVLSSMIEREAVEIAANSTPGKDA